MSGASITTNVRSVISRNDRRIANLRGEAVVRLGRRIGLGAETKARRRLSERQIADRVSSGRLAASIHSELSLDRNGLVISVGTNLIYARIQQEGGVIRPVTVKLVVIPTTKELRRSGVWPRDLPRGYLDFIPIFGRGRFKGILVRAEDDGRISGKSRGRGEAAADRKTTGRTMRAERSRPKSAKKKKGEKGEILYRCFTSTTIPGGREYLKWDTDDVRALREGLAAIATGIR
jgi:phage gpG-like protein